MARKKDATEREVDELLDSLLKGRSPKEIEVPRDRDLTFDPELVRKGQRRLAGFDEKVIALYARGMTTRGIQGHLKELYKVEVSPSLISAVTDAVLADVKAWQGRPLDGAIESVFPKTRVQLCIVHLVRGSLRFVAWKQRKAVARDLRTIYRARSLEAAEP